MALVGSIRVGTISGLVQSLRRTNVKATLLVRSGEDEGHITFSEGELADCEVDVLDGADALDEMLTWSHGQFTLRIIDAAAPDAFGVKGPHVIVVDDELGVRKLIEAFLEAEGYQVSVVSQASQAVNLVDYCKPDLVLLDVMLTGIDGFELAELLRQQYSKQQLPIVMMSANHEFEKKAENKGYPFFSKPFDFKKLCELIDSLTGSAADIAVAQRFSGNDKAGAPSPQNLASGVDFLQVPARFASLLDAEAHLPDLDLCYMVDEMAKARFALVAPSPALAAIVAGFDGFLTLRQWLDEDPDTREHRILMALLLHSVGVLHTADATFGVK
jgi:CheY-like chemotaxis protein